MPSRIDLARLAMHTLEDALAEVDAYGLPIRRTWGQRLALAWLSHDGVAEAWQCREFWKVAADPMRWAHTPEMAQQMRSATLHGLLNCWHLRMGWPAPTPVERDLRAATLCCDIDSDGATADAERMCNLYRLHSPVQAVAGLFDATADDGLNAATEVYPGYKGLVVTGGRIRAMTWGFPVVLKGKHGQPLKPKPVNNARFDKLNGFWRRWAAEPAQRCLIPFNAFAEAVGEPRKMTRTWLSGKDTPIMAWAGLWRQSAEWGDCYTGVMTDNAPALAHIHDRCPVILAPDDWQAWLTDPLPALFRFDRPWPADGLEVENTSDPWVKR
jgi:putative SOS response-associated peptidase YedK